MHLHSCRGIHQHHHSDPHHHHHHHIRLGRTAIPVPALVDARERTTVEVAANGYDTKNTLGNGCSPDGCVPENTRDENTSDNSRWSCKGDIINGSGGCWIEYYFDEPQDIVEIRISFYQGNTRTRTLNVYENSQFHSQIQSSGLTSSYESFYLDTDETSELMLYLDNWESNPSMWLSIKEVRVLAGELTRILRDVNDS